MLDEPFTRLPSLRGGRLDVYRASEPQRLKASAISGSDGTSKLMPFPKP
jgi:hypothetical protein